MRGAMLILGLFCTAPLAGAPAPGQPAPTPVAARPAAQPAAAQPAAAQPQPAYRPAAQPAAPPSKGVYKRYEAQPQTAAAPLPQGVRVSLWEPKVAIQIKGGLAVPLGDLAQYNQAGPGAGVDILYRATEDVAGDFFLAYSSLAYKDASSGASLSSVGGGAKLLYNIFDVEGVTAYFGAGLGFFSSNRAKQVLVVDSQGKPVYDAKGQPQFQVTRESLTGFCLTGGFGLGYALSQSFLAGLDLGIYSISLGGGTSDNLLYAQPSLALAYQF